MLRIDLHTHSVASPDGALQMADYRRMLEAGTLDVIAVTDHNAIHFAERLQRELGERIIVGEEILTAEGDLIGLFLHKEIPSGLSMTDTIVQIHNQGGLTYLPHPFDSWRHSAGKLISEIDIKGIDIVEIYNGRMVRERNNSRSRIWAVRNDKPGAASSDAHSTAGLGKTYTVINNVPTAATLLELLRSAKYETARPSIRTLLQPKLNRLRKRTKRA